MLSWILRNIGITMEVARLIAKWTVYFLLLTNRLTDGQNFQGLRPEVTTDLGVIRGVTVATPSGEKVHAFFGLSYAKSPVGGLRFKPPEPVDPWPGILEADAPPATCYQRRIPLAKHIPALGKFRTKTAFNEDCLQLNIWTATIKNQNNKGLPVIVWFYGGGFARGGAAVDAYDGRVLAAKENIVVVSANYRVASLGFLFLDHPDVPGNAGLHDQLEVLRWVSRHIKHFGGDPERVTLMGQSAGSASVGIHLISDVGRKLFRRAIMQSGAPHAVWAFSDKEESLRNSRSLVDALGCPGHTANMSATLECLRNADPYDILTSEPNIEFDNVYIFKPTIDGVLLKEDPLTAMRAGRFKDTELLIGSTKDEGSMILIGLFPYFFSFRDGILFRHADLSFALDHLYQQGDFVTGIILHHYTDWTDTANSDKNIASLSHIVGDLFFQCPVEDFATAYSKAGHKVYKYFYTHRSSNSAWPKWAGTFHGEDILYVFGDPLHPTMNYTESETRFSRRIMRYWANFARTGNPNSSPKTFPFEEDSLIHFPLYTSKNQEYLILAPNSTAVGSHFKSKKCAFWGNVFPKLRNMKDDFKKSFCKS